MVAVASRELSERRVGAGAAELDLTPLILHLERESSGLSYVYWCLEHLVEELDLTDAVLVAEHPQLGLQIFRAPEPRLDDLALSPVLRAPGLHLVPAVLDDNQRSAVASLCHSALTLELARHDAAHDAMTGLRNRRSFDEELRRLTSNALRHGWPFSVALLDVDRLKAVNDSLGHWEGDRLLQITGAELRRSLRAGDVAARLGGDEFGLLLVSTGTSSAPHLKARMAEAVSARFGADVHFSIGVAASPGESTDAQELYRLADTRLYADKRSGHARRDG